MEKYYSDSSFSVKRMKRMNSANVSCSMSHLLSRLMLPLLAYRYVKNQREKTNREMTETLQSLTSNLPKSIMPDKVRILEITLNRSLSTMRLCQKSNTCQ